MSAFEKLIDALRAHGDNVNQNGDKARAHCPAHSGTSDDSLAIDTRDDGRGIVLHCHAGCTYTDVLSALNLTACDLFDDAQLKNVWNPFAKYIYPGGLQVNRKIGQNGKKTFSQSGIKTDRSLFHADRIGTAMVVYIAEGEKDVLAIEAIGGTAVCSAMGAGKAHIADWSVLSGKHVILIADRDEPGLNHAEDIADILDGIAITVTMVRAAVGKDAADHIAAGKKLSELVTVTGFDDTAPIPLTGILSFPSFPVDAFPVQIADMVNAVAESTQTDTSMAGTTALSALSACAGGHVEIEIRSGWIEPLCTYTATVAESGERKSAVQRDMTRPILDVEEELAQAVIPLRRDALVRKAIAEKALERALNIAAKTDRSDLAEWLQAESNAIAARAEIDSIDVPEVPRIVADDATPEAVTSLLAEHGGTMAVISTEGGVFDVIGGRYNNNIPNMDIWLKGHSADMVRVDRKGRPPEYIPKPALTLGLMIQPEVLKSIAAQHAFRGRGLIARFLYAMPVSQVGYRKVGAPIVPETVRTAYNAMIQKLATDLRKGGLKKLTLTPEAHAAIEVIEAEVEPLLRADGVFADLKDWGSKFVGAIGRIAGLLHIAEHDPSDPVSADTVWRAADIGTYFKFAAIAAFEVMATDPGVTDAVYLLGRIKAIGTDTVSEREMHRACQSRFPKKDTLLAAIDRLVDHGYLLPKAASQQKGRGRPSSPIYKVHLSVNQ